MKEKLKKIPMREIFIFITGAFSGMWFWAFFEMNLVAQAYSAVGVIIAFIFANSYSHPYRSPEEKEMIRQLKNVKRMTNGRK